LTLGTLLALMTVLTLRAVLMLLVLTLLLRVHGTRRRGPCPGIGGRGACC
jgi:hypothetical protein